jgi:hypothetical protein
MGTGKQFAMHEIDETRAAAADDAFEAIITRIKSEGGEVTKDEIVPMYDDIGMDEAETGYIRTIKFTLHDQDFQLIRKVQEHRVTGEGRNKSLEAMSRPRVSMTMKKKKEYSDDWVVVDLEEMF